MLCQWFFGLHSHWLIAPIGASAVLLFAAPASPLAQPWSIIVGNVLSAVAGVLCANLIGHTALAAGIAVMLAIAVMLLTRSLHPPGGAVALTAVIGGSQISDLGYLFVVVPVAINSLLILLIALIYSHLASRRYPNYTPPVTTHHTNDPSPSQRVGTSAEDIKYALAHQEQLLDISSQDLQHVLHDAQQHALQLKIGALRCDAVMSRSVVTVTPESSYAEAWQKLSHHRVKALPVSNSQSQLLGIVTLHDLVIDPPSAQPRAAFTMNTPIAEIMNTQIHTARPEQSLLELAELFADGGLHHLPVVDADRLVGIITQSDMVAALLQCLLSAKIETN
nr:HPP family protein [Chitinibacter bivalviorum]